MFLLEFAGDLHDDYNWSGSPVLNQTGQVVGVYSRVTTPFEGTAKGSTMHAIVSAFELRNLAADLMK
jgi:hypothetical protein